MKIRETRTFRLGFGPGMGYVVSIVACGVSYSLVRVLDCLVKTPQSVRLTVMGAALLVFLLLMRAVFGWIRIREDGIRVKRMFRNRFFAWSDVACADVRSDDSGDYVDLLVGTVKHTFGPIDPAWPTASARAERTAAVRECLDAMRNAGHLDPQKLSNEPA